MVAIARIDIPQPPRQSGDAASDAAGLIEWIWQFYNAVVNGGFLQPADFTSQMQSAYPTLHSFGTLTGSADKLPYFTGADTLALTDISSFTRTLLGNSNQATWQSELGVSAYSDEQAQDAVGGILTDTATIDFTYNDSAPSITADVKAGSITFSLLQDISEGVLIGRTAAGAGDASEIPCVPGVYTPTLTNVANLGASTAYQCQYLRIGDIVTVSGKVDVDPTAAAATTQLGISLPVASNIGATEDCAGVAFASDVAGQGAAIIGDAVNNRAQMQWVAGDITNQSMYFEFKYRVI